VKLTLLHGDCVTRMADMPECSVGAVVCDPPYGLRFMDKEFDDLGDGSAQLEWHRSWLAEAYRVLKTGGVVKAFGGTRTFHHLAATMESVGFVNIRLESWGYGSGFPKSHNIAVYADRLLTEGRSRNIVRHGVGNLNGRFAEAAVGFVSQSKAHKVTTDAAKQWDGWGTALKPAWEPFIVGTKPG